MWIISNLNYLNRRFDRISPLKCLATNLFNSKKRTGKHHKSTSSKNFQWDGDGRIDKEGGGWSMRLKVVCEELRVAKLCVKDGVWHRCVWKVVCDNVACDKGVCVCVCACACVKKGVWQRCVQKLVCRRCVLKMLCVQDGVWQRCMWKKVWQRCVWTMVCDKGVMLSYESCHLKVFSHWVNHVCSSSPKIEELPPQSLPTLSQPRVQQLQNGGRVATELRAESDKKIKP